MARKRRFSRLGVKLVGVSVLGLALAFVVFYLADSVAVPCVLGSEAFTTSGRAGTRPPFRRIRTT